MLSLLLQQLVRQWVLTYKTWGTCENGFSAVTVTADSDSVTPSCAVAEQLHVDLLPDAQ